MWCWTKIILQHLYRLKIIINCSPFSPCLLTLLINGSGSSTFRYHAFEKSISWVLLLAQNNVDKWGFVPNHCCRIWQNWLLCDFAETCLGWIIFILSALSWDFFFFQRFDHCNQTLIHPQGRSWTPRTLTCAAPELLIREETNHLKQFDARDGGWMTCIRPFTPKPIISFITAADKGNLSANRITALMRVHSCDSQFGVGADGFLISMDEEDNALMHRITQNGDVIQIY